jgi:VWFA-related protein
MNRRFWIGLPIILVGVACLAAQDEAFTVKVDVNLVTLQAEAFDANGRPVLDLVRDDFLIYDNGELQTLQHFEPIEAPYSVLGLFDCTGTMREHWSFAAAATTRFVTMLRPQDRVSVSAFGTNLQTLLDWTPRNQWNSNLEIRTDSPVCADTDFFGSMAVASSRLQRISGRTGAVVFTDGIQERLRTKTVTVGGVRLQRFLNSSEDEDFQRALRIIRSGKTPFYFVAISTDLNPAAADDILHQTTYYSPLVLHNMQQVRSRIEQFAEASGGRVVYPQKHSDYIPLFEQIGRELGSSYSLGYVPPAADSGAALHRIEVRVRRDGLRVRQSRQSYGGVQ